ncbi:hypothetical protein, partial [Vibrio parahaemolyticus]|uniref:hypothetical protein n=1 Tax=Vibrio parahaemolyticus TaxID=670 RepID=UPI001C60A6A3
TLNEENYSKIITHSAYRDFFFFNSDSLISINSKLSKAHLKLSSLSSRAKKAKEKLIDKISALEERKLELYSIALRRLQSYSYCSRK